MTIGNLIKQCRDAAEEHRKAVEVAKKTSAKLEFVKALTIEALEEEGTDTARDAETVVTRTERKLPQVVDWEDYYKFIRRNNAFELLHRRPSSQAYNIFMETRKKQIPGVKIYTKVGLNIRKRGAA